MNGDRLMTNGGATNTNSTNLATATTVINTNDSNVKDLNHNHTITSSDKETRPVNYTIRVWKRVS